MLFLYQQTEINVWIIFMLPITAPVEELVLVGRLLLALAFLKMELNLRKYR